MGSTKKPTFTSNHSGRRPTIKDVQKLVDGVVRKPHVARAAAARQSNIPKPDPFDQTRLGNIGLRPDQKHLNLARVREIIRTLELQHQLERAEDFKTVAEGFKGDENKYIPVDSLPLTLQGVVEYEESYGNRQS